MATTDMTFEEFQATKREATAAEIEETGYKMSPPPDQTTFTTAVAGYLYYGNLVIECTRDWGGAYYLLLENRDWESKDLVELEREMFRYAVSSDWIRATCAHCRRILTLGGDVMISEKGNVFCTACAVDDVEEERVEPATVYDLFHRYLGDFPADETLRDVKTEITPCGRDCAMVIVTAAAFAQACDSSMREDIIRLAEDAVGVYWRG